MNEKPELEQIQANSNKPELDLSLDDGFVLKQIIEILRENNGEETSYDFARKQARALLELRYGKSKLLFTRRDVFEIFQRQQSKLGEGAL